MSRLDARTRPLRLVVRCAMLTGVAGNLRHWLPYHAGQYGPLGGSEIARAQVGVPSEAGCCNSWPPAGA